MIGSFVSGLFEGAKTTMDLYDSYYKLESKRRLNEGAALYEQERALESQTPLHGWGGGGEIDPYATSGTSTPPAAAPAETKPPEAVQPGQTRPGYQRGDPALWPQIKPLIGETESGHSYTVGYGIKKLNGTGDTSGYPDMKGFYGFPDRPSVDNSRASGYYQFQPGTWQRFARMYEEQTGRAPNFRLPADQDAVAELAYITEGLRHWAPFNERFRIAAAKAGLMGGAATTAARAGQATPPTVASRESDADIGGGATAPPPDLEGQRGTAKPASPIASALGDAIRAAPALASERPTAMPDGSASMYMPPPTTSASALGGMRMNPVSTPSAISQLSPRDRESFGIPSATSPTTSPAAPAFPTPVKVETPSSRSLSQLRQSQTGPYPPDQRFNSRGEAISRDLAVIPPSVVRGFAAANKITRLPDGTLVDANGNVVQPPPPSALFSR